MKPSLRFMTTALLFSLCLTGCNLEGPAPSDPSQSPVFLSSVKSWQGDERQFVYNTQGWLTKITGKGAYALNDNEESSSEVLFDYWRRVAYVITDGATVDAENIYHYTSDHLLYKLEELINDKIERYYTFEYDANRLLKTRYSFYKDMSGTDAPRVAGKQMYAYDASGNVTEIGYYHKPDPAGDWTLTQTSKFTDYDGKTGVQHMTDSLFTPTIVLQRNNPGKMTTTLANGQQEVTVYTYQYNERNLPVKRTATSNNGDAQEITFTYQF